MKAPKRKGGTVSLARCRKGKNTGLKAKNKRQIQPDWRIKKKSMKKVDGNVRSLTQHTYKRGRKPENQKDLRTKRNSRMC